MLYTYTNTLSLPKEGSSRQRLACWKTLRLLKMLHFDIQVISVEKGDVERKEETFPM